MNTDTTKITAPKKTYTVITKVSKESTNDYKTTLEVMKIVIWPIVVIICFLALKKTIIDLINRINKIGYGNLAAETSPQQNKNQDKTLLEKSKLVEKNDIVEKTLGLFSPETLDKAIEMIDNESKVNEIKDVNDKAEVLHKYSQALYLIITFERTYNLLFGSQLYIIQRVNTTTSETKTSLKRFYDDVHKLYPEFYETYSYDDYFAYLIKSNLIILLDNDSCQITFLGKDLLKYLVETGQPLNKRY